MTVARVVRFLQPGGPEVLQIDEIEVPEPATGQVRISVKAVGLNRAELLHRAGGYAGPPALPGRIGFEASGVIESVGEGVSDLAVGDAVSLVPVASQDEWGAAGELIIMPAEYVFRHPPALSFEVAAASWMQYLTAYGAIIDIANLGRGDYIAITAASSSVGLAAIDLARLVGAIPIAVTRTSAKQQRLLENGAEHVVCSAEEDVAARLAEITGGKGVRVVFDAVGGDLFPSLLQSLSQYGIALVYGFLGGVEPKMPILSLIGNRANVRGWTLVEMAEDRERLLKAKDFIYAQLTSGRLNPVIDRIFPFEDIVESHRYLESNEQFGKTILTLQGGPPGIVDNDA